MGGEENLEPLSREKRDALPNGIVSIVNRSDKGIGKVSGCFAKASPVTPRFFRADLAPPRRIWQRLRRIEIRRARPRFDWSRRRKRRRRRRRGDGPIRRSLHVFVGWIPGGGRHPVPSRAQSTSVRLAAWQTGCSWTCIWNAADKRVSLTAESISFLPVSGIERNSNRWGRERQRQREWRRLGKGLIRRDGREGGEGLSKKNDGENVMMRRGTRIFKMFYTWKFIVSLFWIGKEFVWSIIKQFYLTTSMIIEFKW